MLNLIVNADDLGLSEAVNKGIAEAHLNGIVTAASIMANGAAFDHAVRLCQSIPALDVGIHLTLIEEKPLLRADSIPSLVDVAGRLHRHAKTFIIKLASGEINLQDVRAELEAQIQRVRSHGLSISHLDSHQHVHMLPKILRITVDLAKKYNIPAIRIPREYLRPYMLTGAAGISRLGELLALNTFCRLGKTTTGGGTDHFAGFFFGGNLQKPNLRQILQSLPAKGTCELMCHPGLDDPKSRYRHWRYHWNDELSALIDPEIAEFVQQRGIRLVSYRQFMTV